MSKPFAEQLDDFWDRLEEKGITLQQALRNLFASLTTCWQCNSRHPLHAPVCEVCGNELMEHGKH